MRVILLAVVLTAAAISSSNAYDWIAYNGHSYTVISASRWADGEAEAVGLGGHLVAINDAAENEWIIRNIVDPMNGFAWIGLFQWPSSEEPGEGWVWASGEPVTYTNWYGGEPNNLEGGENWAEIYTSVFGGQWNDVKPETNWRPPLVAIVEIANVPEPGPLLTLVSGFPVFLLLRRRSEPQTVRAGIRGTGAK